MAALRVVTVGAVLVGLALTAGGTIWPALPLAACTLLILLCFCRTVNGREMSPWLLYGSLAFLFFILITLLPMPAGLFRGPRAAYFNNARVFLDGLAAFPSALAGPHRVFSRLSLNLSGSIRFLFLAAGSWALFFLAAGGDERWRRNLLQCLVLIGAVIAAAGIVGQLLIPQERYAMWLVPTIYGHPMGPFVNRNHFALFCALQVPGAIGLAVVSAGFRPGVAEAHQGGGGGGGWRRALNVLLLAVLVSGVFISLSRSGVLALASGAAVTALCWIRARPLAATGAAILGAAILATVVLWPTVDSRERIESLRNASTTASARTRFQMWGDALSVWRDFPVTGCGFEGFRTVYAGYKSSASRKGALHCENEYVQWLAESGIMGVMLALMVVYGYWRTLRRRAGVEARSFAGANYCGEGGLARGASAEDVAGRSPAWQWPLAAGVGAVVLVHGLFDFGMRMPLNAFMAFGYLGLAVSAPSGAGRGRGALGRSGNALNSFSVVRVTAGGMALILLILLLATGRAAWRLDKDWELRRSDLTGVSRAIAWAPGYWYGWYELSRQVLTPVLAEPDNAMHALRRRGWTEVGRASMYQAAALNPRDYRVWRVLADVEKALGNQDLAAVAAAKAVELRPWLDGGPRPGDGRNDSGGR